MIRRTRPALAVAALVMGAAAPLVLQGAPARSAEVFVVNATADMVDASPGDGVCETATGNNVCTLRAAVQEANALPGADTITVPAGAYTLTLTGSDENASSTGDLDVTDSLTINGAGPQSTLFRGGDGEAFSLGDRVLDVRAGTTVLTGVTIEYGYSLPDAEGDGRAGGAGIRAASGTAVTLDDVRITGNVAQGTSYADGGGIRADGSLTATYTAIFGNSAAGMGGGVAGAGGPYIFENVTISSNWAGVSAGGLRIVADGTMNNVTITGNVAVYSYGAMRLQNRMYTWETLALSNTIVAGNSPAGCYLIPFGYAPVVTSLGYDLGSGDCGIGGGPGDVVASSPGASPVALNGGSTETNALVAGSPAIDAGNPAIPGSGGTACAEKDQRGYSRVDRCDIGAFELSGTSPDSAAPTTTITLAPTSPDGDNGWYRSDVHALILASDGAGSGVAETRCALDPTAAPTGFDAMPAGCGYTGAGALVTADRTHVLYAASIDANGNKESPVSASFKIDGTLPAVSFTGGSAPASGFQPAQTITAFPATVGTPSVDVEGTAQDTTSGVASVEVDGEPAGLETWNTVAVPLTEGSNTVTATATDAAGNIGTAGVTVTYNPDLDGDGIVNPIDGNSAVSPPASNATTPSERFSDKKLGGTTSGIIIDRGGNTVKVADVADGGVSITVIGSGKARVRLDGKPGTWNLSGSTAPGGVYVLTDPETTQSVSVASVVGEATLTVDVAGVPTAIVAGPGDVASITETTDGLGNVTGLSVSAVAGVIEVNGEPVSAGHQLGLAELSGRFSAGRRGFDLNAIFALGPDSDGIGPALTGSVQLEVGTWSSGDIPASSFKRDKSGRYKYTGARNGVQLDILIGPLETRTPVRAAGTRTGFDTFAAPLSAVTLTIGNDVGVMDL